MKVDGRKLNHSQLEAIRFAAVKAVQAGAPPTTVAREMGLYTNRVSGWRRTARVDGTLFVRGRPAVARSE